MNPSKECHEIPHCPGLYIDAFRGPYLRKTQHMEHAFILTHYHGDHYGKLPRDNKYQGPALIHCTPVTAALLRKVHQVPDIFIVEHPYGETFFFRPVGSASHERARITLYDANHCPGAAIVLVELLNGDVHLHTGDMRYHDKMKSYPLVQAAALARKIDLLFLDTTYANPKYDFLSQEEAVDTIASQIHELLGSSRSDASETLILLSCYSIGKEKCLWEASTRCHQLVYVSERKLDMLQCIEGYDDHVSSQIGRRCTRDPSASDMHVIPMGLAGHMHPFFQPNFEACADYAREVPRPGRKPYTKVVAFIPTGWADASNWNRKNSVSQSLCKDIQVEVRLVCYSEHSTFSELQAFVSFLKPRKVIPTVFSDKNDKRRIEARFQVDVNRAKKSLIESMFRSSSANPLSTDTNRNDLSETSFSSLEKEMAPKRQKMTSGETPHGVTSLEDMGFSPHRSKIALESCHGNLQAAIEWLLSDRVLEGNVTDVATNDRTIVEKKGPQKKLADKSKNVSSQRITDFFRPK
ncbi:DNA cross-link repair 1A protein [Fistulifera solaris]|uniref:DNA cross-link repair 1A protein n=1 Tax=Fistulifera solaris TaxID=1519565 RepID=A0A1Z5KC00_FISSO|nr:DNA cross-link repair 1A protein [Fistulifera solaris]|eukprot:GAX23621.1 DNA cross-link repair 1A protein [Fistulifera solaris]